MKTSRIAASLLSALFLVGALSACATHGGEKSGASASEGSNREPYISYAFEKELPDGRTVLCVWASDASQSGGLSCDWENAARGVR